MAAFCGCCGAEIADWNEACPVCGTPRHGSISSGALVSLAEDTGPFCCSQQEVDAAPSVSPCQKAPGESRRG